jgi:hypothetical protein
MKKMFFLSSLAGSVTSGGLFFVCLSLVWLEPVDGVGLTAFYLWIAPGLLIQGRSPSEAVYDIGVAPPDLTTWIICFLFWVMVGVLLNICIGRILARRRLGR